MNEGELTALFGGLGTLGTGIAWVVHRWDKRRKAIPREEADMARAVEDAPEAATEAVEEALRVVKQSLVDDLKRVRTDAARDRARFEKAISELQEDAGHLREDAAHKGTELARLRSQVLRLAGVLSRDVTSVLDWIEGGAKPPPPHEQVRVLRGIIRDLDQDTDTDA